MPIDVALLGCAHPHVADVLGVLASEPDLRLAAAWDADPSAVPAAVAGSAARPAGAPPPSAAPAAIAGSAVARAETAIRRADAVIICAPTHQRPALSTQAARA